MDQLAFALGAGLPAGSFWFVIVYFACKGTYKRSLGWPMIFGAWLLVVILCGLAGAIARSFATGPVLGLIDSIATTSPRF